ncbi:hypothetical protein LHU53_18730 [Rhodoferax sp. U2-2l]|uniref:hypothetical protein n=1 Tax=Rhodoferax sp. U2-2l TaxID=2884000 RepID=UPI001D0AACA1|nr:hypothetical protein [Rhodoferax sp. U2-2l]MCB8748930.1 hypothetical protein [Rhodoferax sp. U2-2l]
MKNMNTLDLIAAVCHVRHAPDVNVQPRIRVLRWRTYPFDGEQVLVCELPGTSRIRVTTAIAHWDTTTREIVTQLGGVYEVVEPMAEDSLDFRLALVVEEASPDARPL